MVSFGQSLKTWKNANCLSSTDLAQRSGIAERRLYDLLADREEPTVEEIENLSKAFQVSVVMFTNGVQLATPIKNQDVEANSVSSSMALYRNAYAKYHTLPKDYQLKVARLFARWLEKHLKMSGSKIENITKCGTTTFSAYRTEKYSMTLKVFCLLGSELSRKGLISEKEYLTMFDRTINNYIGNYNLSIVKRKYQVPMAPFSVAVGKASTSGNQLLRFEYPMSEPMAKAFALVLNVDANTFRTRIMSEDDFTVSKESILSFIHDTNNARVTEDDAPSDTVLQINENDNTEVATSEPNEDIKPDIKIDDNCARNGLSKVKKMYAHLSEAHRADVNALIEKYFWEDL